MGSSKYTRFLSNKVKDSVSGLILAVRALIVMAIIDGRGGKGALCTPRYRDAIVYSLVKYCARNI